MATLKEIAAKCGVSTAAVSKALNGYSDIGGDTARRIRRVASEMGYVPNMAARTLKTKRANNLGVMLIDNMGMGLRHEHFAAILESFKSRAEKRGYDITFISRNLGGGKMSFTEHCHYRGCDGVMIACVDFKDPQVAELVGSEIPCITVDYVFDGCPAIMSDNASDMEALIRYVYQCGHRKIALIYGEDTFVTQKRLAGYYHTCQSLGLEAPGEYVRAAQYHNTETSRTATRELLGLRDAPSCILYPDDFSCIGGMNELERMGLKIPADISVAGYDGLYLLQALRPKLTTIRQSTEIIGALAADHLIATIEQPETAPRTQVVIKGELLKGSTVGMI